MLRLTRLNGAVMHVNADLVATVEEHHDTVVTLVDGKTYVVQETAGEVVRLVIAYRGAVLAAAERLAMEDRRGSTGQLLVLHPPADVAEERS